MRTPLARVAYALGHAVLALARVVPPLDYSGELKFTRWEAAVVVVVLGGGGGHFMVEFRPDLARLQ
jgi:hypothetical protein